MPLILPIPKNSLCPSCFTAITDISVMISGNVAWCAECYRNVTTHNRPAIIRSMMCDLNRRNLHVVRGIVFFVATKPPPVALYLLKQHGDAQWLDPRTANHQFPTEGPLFAGLDEGLYETARHVLPLDADDRSITQTYPNACDE